MLRRLSPVAELILVNLICFGPFAARSIVELAERNTTIVFDDRRALFTISVEVVCGTLALLLLRARGWKPRDLGLRITMPQTIAGNVLLIGCVISLTAFTQIVRLVIGVDTEAVTSFEPRTSWLMLIVLTLINPMYDELLVVAYNLEAAKGSGAAFAITLSAAVRFVCHLEQGPVTAVTILPLGLIFAFVYWRWRRVWPLVVAHGMLDFIGMMPR
jgi:membrane protease YdiL (CAAX protease family)